MANASNALNLIATGNISPATFAALDSTKEHGGKQAGAGDIPCGIVREAQKYPPLPSNANFYACEAGDPIPLAPAGIAPVTLLVDGSGTAITPGMLLKPKSGGIGVAVDTAGTTTTPQHYGARALEGATTANAKIAVEVVEGVYTYHA